MTTKLASARRVVDFPEFYGGGYDLITGRRTAQPPLSKSPTAFACMMIRGQELAQIPWHIKKNDKILDKHVLIDMLRDFGPESNYQKGMCDSELDLLTYGAAFWLRDYDILKRLDPDTMKVIKGPHGVTGFKQTFYDHQDHEKTISYKRDEVVYFREYHPSDWLGFGVPVVQVCKKSIEAEIEALLMIEAYFKNDAVPGLLLTTDNDVTEKEANRVISWWNKRFRGGRNKGKVGIAGKGLKPAVVGSNMKDSGVMEVLSHVHSDICRAMRVDKILVGEASDATYVNLAETRKFFIEDVIIPRALEYQNVINQDLAQVVDSGVIFEFAFDELQIFAEDALAKQERLIAALTAGVIDEDFIREEMGYPASAKPAEKPEKEQVAEDKWQRKAVKALQRGDNANVAFESDYIPVDRSHVISGRLSNATTVDAVRACFD